MEILPALVTLPPEILIVVIITLGAIEIIKAYKGKGNSDSK